MNRAKTFLYAAIELILVLVLALTAFVLLRSNTRGTPEKTSRTGSSQTPPGDSKVINQSYPPPMPTIPFVTEAPEPTREFILVGTDEYAAPTEFHPTFTPFPTPTLRLGATPTPYPLVQPAKDATGTILYFAKQSTNGVALRAISVDAMGLVKSTSEISTRLEIPEGDLFPSPNGNYAVVMGAWGVGSVMELLAGKAEPFSPRVGRMLFFNWYPDNRQVLIRDDFGNLLLVEPLSGDYIPLAVPGYGAVDGAAASPDGQSVIYSYSKESGSTGLWIVNSDGRDARLLFDIPVSTVTNFAWSPDGKQIVYMGDGWTVMNADGSNLHKLGYFSIAQCYFLPPLWSPDSHILAITTSTRASFCNGWSENVFKDTNTILIDVESGKSRSLLPDGSTGNIDPAWSPDGKQVVFVSNRSGAPEIWVINADGTNLRQLTNDGQYKRFTLWRKP